MHVKIISDGTPFGTRVETADGSLVEGLTGVTFRAEVDAMNRAEIHLGLVRMDAEAEGRVFIGDKEVHRIEYADGTSDEYPSG